MKRTIRFLVVAIFVLAAAVVFSTASYASEPDSSGGGIPEPIRQARRSAMDKGDVIVGIGTARTETISQSRAAAIDWALTNIVQQIDFSVSYYDPVNETHMLARNTMRGATIIEEYLSPDGQYWMVIMLSRSAARAQEVSAGIEWAIQKMDEAFERLNQNNVAPLMEDD